MNIARRCLFSDSLRWRPKPNIKKNGARSRVYNSRLALSVAVRTTGGFIAGVRLDTAPWCPLAQTIGTGASTSAGRDDIVRSLETGMIFHAALDRMEIS